MTTDKPEQEDCTDALANVLREIVDFGTMRAENYRNEARFQLAVTEAHRLLNALSK